MNRTLLLARTFFSRFFESDLMPPGLPQAQLVIWSMAALATPGLLLPVRFASRFLQADSGPMGVANALHTFRLLFITLTMTAVGMVALVIWDGIFPDRRDARILTSLPVPGRVLVGARLLALAALCGIFVAGVNVVPAVLYAPMIAAFGGAANQALGILAYVVATTFAGAFVFCALVALQGIVLNLGGRRAGDRLSLLLQIVFVTMLLQMVFFMPRVGGMLAPDLSSGWLRAMPSVWFLGLYDVLGGQPVAGAPRLAVVAVFATAMAVAAAVLLFVCTHARLTRRALESQETKRRGRVAQKVVALLTSVFCRRPVTRGAFEFTLQTLARSRSHRLLMSIYVGIGLALIASAIVPIAIRRGLSGFMSPSLELLSAPLVITFFTLIGARVALAIPIEPRAVWAIRIAEPANRPAAMAGVRAALVLAGVGPATLLAASSATLLWGPRAAVLHTFVCLAMGVLLVDILLIRLAKLPFTCTYFPGKAKAGTLWPLYLTGFATYAFTTARFELALFNGSSLGPLVVFAVSIGSAIGLLAIHRRRHLATLSGFRFEEEDPDSMFAGFQLSEGLAAAPKEARQLR
jgi:hypothetical protein